MKYSLKIYHKSIEPYWKDPTGNGELIEHVYTNENNSTSRETFIDGLKEELDVPEKMVYMTDDDVQKEIGRGRTLAQKSVDQIKTYFNKRLDLFDEIMKAINTLPEFDSHICFHFPITKEMDTFSCWIEGEEQDDNFNKRTEYIDAYIEVTVTKD